MTTLPNMGLILPTRGAPGSGHWADTVDADLALMDAHNHQSGRGLPINSAALAIDGDVSFGSLWAVTNMQRVSFAAVTALAANNKSLFVSLADNELYWRSNAGSNVKLTAANALNVAAFVGGIGGDYTSVSAAENYDDANKRYTFKQGGGSNWAKLQGGGLRLVEFGTAETVFVEQLCPAALASSYSVTWPVANPGSQALVQIDSAGQLIFSNTLAASQKVRFGTYTLQMHGSNFNVGNIGTGAITGTGTFTLSGASGFAVAPIVLEQGARILAVRLFCADSATGPTKVQVTFSSLSSTGSLSNIASSAVSAGTGANQTLPITGLTTTLATNTVYDLNVALTTGAATCSIYGAEIDYDYPP